MCGNEIVRFKYDISQNIDIVQCFRDQRWKPTVKAAEFDDETSCEPIHTFTSQKQSSSLAMGLFGLPYVAVPG